jgi:hypothetical protein
VIEVDSFKERGFVVNEEQFFVIVLPLYREMSSQSEAPFDLFLEHIVCAIAG